MSSGPQKKPTPIQPTFANFPAELKSLPNWVLWRYLPPKSNGGKWRKVPFQPNGETASTTDRSTWNQFDACCAAYAQRGFDGLGFVFDGDIGADGLCYCGVDFDACVRDGTNVDSLARSRIKRLNTYTEASVSGTGFHCIVRAEPLDRIVKHDGVEIYTNARYFTFTGRAFGKIKTAPTQVRALVDEIRAKEAAAKQQQQSGRSGSDGASSTELTNPFNNAKPAQAFAALDLRDSLADGIKTTPWFETLSPEQKDEVVDHALGMIAKNTQLLELESNGGNNAEYYKLTVSAARSGAPNAEDIFVKHASSAKNADSDDALRQYFSRCQASPRSSTQEITVGTLLHLAQQQGANFDQWKRQVPSVPALPPEKRKPLKGGMYSADEALELLNSHYLIGKSDQEVGIFRIKDDGSLAFRPPEQFKLDVDNIFVLTSAAKPVPVEKFWKQSPRRHERTIVFRPAGTTEPQEFNLWGGFGVVPRKTRRHILSLLRHIWKVICRSNKDKFRYLIRWLAYAVQHPDKCAGVVVVLKSRKQGTGKTTLGWVMLKIFGLRHGALVDDKDRLLGRFNDWLEPMCFVLAEEILWAGDHRTADRLKSFITAETIQIERKNGGIRQIPNRLHAIMTTNHDHAIPAGVGDRRFFVLDVSDEHACDKSWFDRLYQDLNNGGTGEFLDFLQGLQLGDWHPREILKTAEATEQQRMSGDSVAEWSQASIDADGITVTERGTISSFRYPLGMSFPSDLLREAYTLYCKAHSLRPVSEGAFGKACTEMFGQRKRLPTDILWVTAESVKKDEADEILDQKLADGVKLAASRESKAHEAVIVARGKKRRPWGYEVPDGDTWQEKLDARFGIKK